MANTPEPVQPAAKSGSATDAGAQRIAAAAAEQIAAAAEQIAAGAAAAADAPPVTGAFTVEVEFNGTTYALVVTGPTADNDNSWVASFTYQTTSYEVTVRPPSDEIPGWFFSLQRVNGTDRFTIAEFGFLDADNWELEVGLPAAVTFGSFSLKKLSLKLERGDKSPLIPIEPAGATALEGAGTAPAALPAGQ